MKQPTLFDFSRTPAPPEAEYRIPSLSREGTIYPVSISPDYCPCKGFQYRNDCIHVQRARNAHLLKQNEYLKTRYERKTAALFPNLETVMEHFMVSKSAEVEYLAVLFLGILYAGDATTDDLYDAVGGQFSSDPRIIGAVTRALLRHDLIKHTGNRVPSRRKKIHGDMQPIYRITEKGRALLENGGA